MYVTHNLSHANAQKMIASIQKELEAANKAACVAVCDAHGELVAFLRMDGCRLPPLTISMNKAFTAAREGRPSGEVGESLRKAGYPMTNLGDPRYTGFPGGIPLISNGKVVGAIGVSGLADEEDIRLAETAAKLLE